jgi:hypothetical protein
VLRHALVATIVVLAGNLADGEENGDFNGSSSGSGWGKNGSGGDFSAWWWLPAACDALGRRASGSGGGGWLAHGTWAAEVLVRGLIAALARGCCAAARCAEAYTHT